MGKPIAMNMAGILSGAQMQVPRGCASLRHQIRAIAMRIKYTSIHNVLESNSIAPWVGLGLAEKLRREALLDLSRKEKKQTAKSDRAVAWFRRSR